MERLFAEDEETMKRKQNSREIKEERERRQSKRAIAFTEENETSTTRCSDDP